ncbi:TolC family outer membrane protein [Candidatus Berkiella aquae]|uniref:Outer membrane efflux protein BepC n=1 Tax=Candidatus Berkiella aquae TaxID=295108 RepID=A0A0Q9YYA7_9GAMM|nr:TolC family outer membrane protein [Candidatus Berkiella aquae]MCS5712097.1 TolC family outer membrane protein [Candidatus Berkiella aquae]
MSKNRFLKILLPSIALTFGTQAYAYTVREAVAHTLATSPDFLISTNVRDEVDKQLRQSYAGYLPSVDLTAGMGQQYTNNSTTRGYTGFNGITGGALVPQVASLGTTTMTRTEFALTATQMLFDGFAVYHDVEGHKARVRAESWRVNGSAQDTALKVAESFINVLQNREMVLNTKDNLATIERIYGQIQKRSEGGIGRKADLDQAEARVALARVNYIAQQALLRDAETAFLRQIGIPTPSHLTVPETPPGFPHSENAAVELGLKCHPVLRASIEDVQVTRDEYKGTRAPFVPRLDLQLGHTRNHNLDGNHGDSDDNTAMVRARWNLFKGGKDLAAICEKASKMQEAQEVSNRAQRQVVESVRLAWNLYQTALDQLPSLKEHVDASLKTREAYHKQFNIGQRTLLDLLDAENELFGARQDYIQGRYKRILGQYRVMNATGDLTRSLGVALPYQAEPRPTGVMDGAARFFDKTSTLFD